MAKYYAVIPAAGFGARMGSEVPKQYLPVRGRPLIYYAVAALCACPRIERVFVVLAPGDTLWTGHDWQAFSSRLLPLRCGGSERFESVLNGLRAVQEQVRSEDWVMVHDAARPCLDQTLLDKLIGEVGDDPVGGLLAVPVADTLKRADPENRVLATEPRAGLWQAQTPQMFRYGLLLQALTLLDDTVPTDEAQAVEQLGFAPRLVASDARNFKVTYPRDLELAELILAHREGKA